MPAPLPSCKTPPPNREKLQEFAAWCAKHTTGDEKGEAQIFLDHLFHGFGHPDGLKEAGATLDAAVLAAYCFSAKKDLLAQLLALNQQVAAKIEKGESVTSPGIPKNYPDPKTLVTEDCIRPGG